MDSKCQFYALEVMCRERTAMARKEMEYWLNEAEEWAQLRKSKPQRRCLDHNKSESRTASTHLDLSDSRRRCRAIEGRAP
jgi:hypothetical protein